ncbi:MAG: response regulator [Planctomycetota bacterium]
MSSPSSGRVLVADNDLHVAQVLRIFLERAGLAVEHALDGGAAHARIAAGGVDALICDLDMPVLSGEALIARLEREAAGGVVPQVFVISGYLDHALEGRLRRSPLVREVLRKPFDLASFAQRVVAWVHPRDADATACE